jgi:hypothetical protein
VLCGEIFLYTSRSLSRALVKSIIATTVPVLWYCSEPKKVDSVSSGWKTRDRAGGRIVW